MSAETSRDASHIQDEDVLRKMWQDTEDFGKKKEIRSHMYKLREERLKNFYSTTTDSSSEIHRAQSTPGLHDTKIIKEGNGPTHADSLADHSFLSLKSKEIRDSESPTREMHYRVTADKTRSGDQGWQVVEKNKSSTDGKTHTTSRIATTSGSDNIDGGVANYAAKCEQKASVYSDGDANNFTKSVAASSKNVIQQDAKGGDANSNFQSYSTSSSSSSKVVTHHQSKAGDTTTDLKALPSPIQDSNTSIVRRVYTTDVPTELKKNPNYIDGTTKVTTETRTLPDGTKVTTTRYETKGSKTIASSSSDHHTSSSKQCVSEQKSSTVKSTSNKSEHHSSNKIIQDSRNVYDDTGRNTTEVIRQVPVNFNSGERTITTEIIRSTGDDTNRNASQNTSKTTSSTVNIEKNQQTTDSRHVNVNVETDCVVQGQDVRNIRQELITTKRDSSDVPDDVRIIKVIQESEYLPRDRRPDHERIPKDQQTSTTVIRRETIKSTDTVQGKSTRDISDNTQNIVQEKIYQQRQPEFEQPQQPPQESVTSTTTIRKEVITKGDNVQTQDFRNTTQNDVRTSKVIQESSCISPKDSDVPKSIRPREDHQEVVTTRKEVITTKNTSEDKPTTQDDVYITRIIKETEYLPRDKQPGYETPGDRTPRGRTPAYGTPGDRTPAVSTPGDRTPGDRTPAVLEAVCRLVPQQERPIQQPDNQQPDSYTSKTTTTTVTTKHVDNKIDNKKTISDTIENDTRVPRNDVTPHQKEPSPQYETPEKRKPIRPGKSELDKKPTPTDGQYQTTYRTDYVNKRISVEVSPTHQAFASSLRCISPDRDKKRGSTRSLKSSTSSLRSSTSPEKYPVDRRQPGRYSPDRKPGTDSPHRGTSPTKRTTPDKFTSTETVTKVTVSPTRRSPTKQTPNETINTDTITRRRKDDTHSTITCTTTRSAPERKPTRPSTNSTDDYTRTTETIDSSTLTRRPKNRPRSRSASPTSIASDIEFIKSNRIVTDLDDETINTTIIRNTDQRPGKPSHVGDSPDKRPSSLDVTTTTKKTTKKITERSPTSPLSDFSPTKKSPNKDKPQEKPLKRRDTYEERCRQILGISDKTTIDKNVTETRKTTTSTTPKKSIPDDQCKRPSKSPEKTRSPTKEIQEFPAQVKRSPEKQPLESFPGKHKPIKEAPKVQEFPSQIRRSPEKQPLERPPEKSRPSKDKPSVQEFPSQIRRSPEKLPLEKPPEKSRPLKQEPKIQEFPSQIRRSPEKEPRDNGPQKDNPVAEYPSLIKKVPKTHKVPGAVDEPVFTQRFISTLCREEESERTGNKLPRDDDIPFGKNTDQPHKTVKKDSPEKELNRYPQEPSPERRPVTNTGFIDTERRDTDITITDYEKDSRYPIKPLPLADRASPDCRVPNRTSPERVSPDRTLPQRASPDRKLERETYDSDTHISVTNTTKRTDSDVIRKDRVTDITVSEYTDEYDTTSVNKKQTPKRPDRELPTRRLNENETTEFIDVTEYTDEYCKDTPNKGKPQRRRPGEPQRESPERFVGTTKYSDEYSTTNRSQQSTDRITKTTKSTRPTPNTKIPKEPEESTTDSEIDNTTCTRTIKETTTTTMTNGDISKKPVSSTKSGPKSEPKRINEFPSQKPKQTTTVPKTIKTTVRKDVDTRTEDKTYSRTQKIDDSHTIKTIKHLTNGDVPKHKISPKPSKPNVMEYPSQRKPLADKLTKPERDTPSQRKPLDVTPDRRTPKRTEITKTIYSPRDKPRSPERYSPTRYINDKERIHTIQTVTHKATVTKKITDVSETKPKAKSPIKSVYKQPETQQIPKRHIVTTTIQVTPKVKQDTPRKPVQKTTVSQTILKTTRTSPTKKIVEKVKPRKPLQNGRPTTEEDSDTECEIVETGDIRTTTRRTDAKVTRTTSDQIIRTPKKTPVRGLSKPELISSTKPSRPHETDKVTRKTDKKVITTKSIIINNDFNDDREIIINLQRSKSSREPTPDRIYPRPASEDEDIGIPRYPDQISEPDEPGIRRKPTRLSDIPLIESEDTSRFTRITEYDDTKTQVSRRVNKVEETDECLLSVNQKVSKFVDEADKLTKKPRKPPSPTRKSPRPDIVVDDTIETDETYTSVTDKVNKFVTTTTDHLTTRKDIAERPKSPKCRNYPDEEDDDDNEQFTNVSKKVSHFIETAEKIKSPQKPKLKDGPAPKVKRPDFENVDENIRTDDCLLSVSDKVSKFTTSAKKLQSPDYKKPVSLAKMDITPKRESPVRECPNRESPVREHPKRESPVREYSKRESPVREYPKREFPVREYPKRESPVREYPKRESPVREYPKRDSPVREYPRRDSPRRGSPGRDSTSKITTECVQIDSEEQSYTRRLSPDRYSPTRRGSSPRPYTRDDQTPTKQSSLTRTDIQQTKYTRKDSSIKEPDSTPISSRVEDEQRSVLSPTGRLRSTESIRRAKELFENIAKEQKVTKQRDILSRPSVFDSRKQKPTDADKCTKVNRKEEVKLTDIGVYNIKTNDIKTKLRYSSDDDTETTESARRISTSTYNKDDNLKSTRLIMDRLNRPHSPDKYGDTPGYLKPLDRSARPRSPYQDRSRSPKPRSEDSSRDRSPRPHDPSLDEIPHYMWPLDRTVHDHGSEHERSRSRSREPTPDHHARLRSRGSTPDGNVPGYMKPLDRRPKSPPGRTVDEREERVYKKHSVDDTDKTTKFGVTLRRTDSGRAVTSSTTSSTVTTTSQKRKFSQVEIEKILATQEIEEIYDIELLEVLLERVTIYELRRRIRSQIRIVKQLISENKLTTVISKKTTKTVSPTRDSLKPREKSPDKLVRDRGVKPTDNKHYQYTDSVTRRSDIDKKSSEYHSTYSYSERRTSSEMKTQIRGSSPETKIVIREKSPDKAPRKSITTTTTERIIRHSPERKTEKAETKSVFKTELRRTAPASKTVVEDTPSWVTQRPLKKITDSVPTKKTSSTTTTTTTKKQTVSRTSPSKERKPTDDITSSYGVGPTDENGSPLFGLKALRAQNRTDKTKVQGTVIRSHYYAENGQEPVGQVSVTKYSTDPRDLDGNVEDRNGLVSVTTTQKFGTKGTPSLRSITDKKRIADKTDEDYETITKKSTSTKVSRRGSVKEMSKKFIENAVETSKNEKQSSYPKAGLILRTSSFKDTVQSDVAGSSRESSPEKQEAVCKTVTVKKTTTSSSSEGRTDSFLNNQTRVRGVQDVITRMKNADDDFQADDTPEDKEARSLLNKFIGSQVILSGMETRSSSSPSATTTVKRTTTTTSSTSKGGGKPTVITRTFTHPITPEELTTVWDEQTLKLLLERSTEYEERQLIRARLREVMAEQEVCADVVAKTKEESSGRVEGESLLLPLLQGLLDAPDNEQTADSGTESGEDLRSGLLNEVQNVLSKLANNLKSDNNDMPPDKRSSLLQLVTRLQTGLSTSQSANSGERRGSSGTGRFGRRRRQNRHTVGVSSEELEDARRLMQEFGLCDLNSEASTPSTASQTRLPLQKQNSEGSVLQKPSQFKSVNSSHKMPVKNATAKPFGSSASTSRSHSGTSSTVETPTEVSETLEFPCPHPETKPPDTAVYLDTPQPVYNTVTKQSNHESNKTESKPKHPPETVSSNFISEIGKKSVTKTNQIPSPIKVETYESTQESETDEDTVKAKQTPIVDIHQKVHEEQVTTDNESVKDYETRPNLVLQSNPIYYKPQTPDFDDQKLNNRFNSKKLKMKRANTIDIPKPLEFYETEDDYESDTSLVDKPSRINNYLALRGPIRVGRTNNNSGNLPVFEPKTESDRKFMAFINKHNDANNKGSLWSQQRVQTNDRSGTNWNNRFGNIKTAFEIASTSTPSTPNTNMSSARNFWKSADDAVSAGRQSYNGPKVSKQGARNLQQMFEERDKQAQQKTSPWDSGDEKNIVTGTLKVDTKGIDAKKNYRFVPQPLPVNQFSHAPTSAFAAIPKKNPSQVTVVTQPMIPSNSYAHPTQQTYVQSNHQPEPSTQTFSKSYKANCMQHVPKVSNHQTPKSHDSSYAQSNSDTLLQPTDIADNIIKSDYKETDESNNSTPLYLYSPKSVQTSPQNLSTNTSPSSTPWTSSVTEHRVHKLATSKFENLSRAPPQPEPSVIKPRRMSKEKILPVTQSQIQENEKLTAPYLVKSVDKSSTVKKISDRFNKNSTSPDSYSSFTSVKYGQTKPNIPDLNNYQPQNYTITYPNAKHQIYPTKQTEHEYQPYQKYQQKRESEQRYNSTTQSYQKYPQEQYQRYSQPSNTPTYQTHVHQKTQTYSQPSQTYQKLAQTYSQPAQTTTQPVYTYNQPQSLSSNSFKTKNLETKSKPQNYSVQYNQPQKLHTTPKVYQEQSKSQKPPEEYTSKQFIQFNQPKPVKESQKHSYTSKQSKPQETLPVLDYSSPESSPTPQKPKYQRQSSQESVKEYEAAVTRVMKGPVSHQAVTVQQKSPKGRDEHEMEAAFNLKSVLQKFSQLEKGEVSNNTKSSKSSVSKNAQHEIPPERKLSMDSAVLLQCKNAKASATTNLQRTQSFKKPCQAESENTPSFLVNGKPLSMESTEINEDGESVITSKFHIPVTISTTKPQVSKPAIKVASPTKQMLSKSDSWHQLMHEQHKVQQKQPVENSKPVVRSKSSHTLAVPTVQFQAGMTRDEVVQKRKTIEAYFSGKMSPQELKSSTKTITEGPVTTTQVTTTRVTSQQQVTKKPMSPFAKFRQLDKQNSLNTPPGTPRTPTGSRPLFKFTDPELNRQASTVKERLLQWCQMKTKEYENVQLDNFSSSWADGLAFCALIHHFLPDAFDYHALTPKERRHNFTLAFRVADEKADILPLLDVDDMVATRKPDWKCVFTYVQTIYSRFKDED